jgi:hypothetical protein
MSPDGWSFPGLQKRRWSIALLFGWVLYLTAISAFGLWQYVSVSHLTPLFADLRAILSARDCQKLGYDVFTNNPCDPWGRVHVYGSAWLRAGGLGLGARDGLWLGIVLDSIFILLAAWIVNPTTFGEFIIGVLILFSPAVTLALERANNDLVVFGLLYLSACLVAGKNQLGQVSAFVVTYLSASLKIYPAVLFGAIPLVAKTRKEFVTAIVCAVVLTVAWLLLNAHELLLLQRIVPRPVGRLATGGTLLFQWLGFQHVFPLSLGFAIIALICSIIVSRNVKLKDCLSMSPRKHLILFDCGLSVMLFTFLANTNYDYRWIFFALLLPFLFEVWRYKQTERVIGVVVSTCLLLAIFVVWSEAATSAAHVALRIILKDLSFSGRSEALVRILDSSLGIAKQLSAWILLTMLCGVLISALADQRNYLGLVASRMFAYRVKGTVRDREK